MIKSFSFFNHIRDNKINSIFKENKSYKLIQTKNYRFLDARHYCPSTFNLDSFIKTYWKI